MSATLTAEQAAALQASGRIRVMWRDDDAAHQIRIHYSVASTKRLEVTCTCRKRAGLPPLEARDRWDAHEAQAVYRAHLAEEGAAA